MKRHKVIALMGGGVLVLLLLIGLASLMSQSDLGSYRVGDVYSTIPTTHVVDYASGRTPFLVGTVGQMGGSYEKPRYVVPPGTQIRVTRIHDANSLLSDRHPPAIYAEIITGIHAGDVVLLSELSVIRDKSSRHPKRDPSPRYLSPVTRGKGQ